MKTLANAADRREVRERLSRLTPDSPRRWGRMTPHQMLCHVADAFRLALGEKPAAEVGTVVHRTLIRWIVLYLPVPAPRGYPTLPEADAEREGTRPVEFAADHAEALRLLDRFASGETPLDGRRHPIFGRMSAAQWRRWGHVHTEHHLRQFGL